MQSWIDPLPLSQFIHGPESERLSIPYTEKYIQPIFMKIKFMSTKARHSFKQGSVPVPNGTKNAAVANF